MHESLSNFGNANCDSSALECRLLTLSNAACMHSYVDYSTSEYSNARKSQLLVQIIAACMHCNTGEHISALGF